MRSPLCLSSRFRRKPVSLAMALALVLLAGCGGGDIILPEDGAPAAIAVVNGDGQRGLVGEPLANPLVVEVTDSRGRTVSGATVAFEFGAGGAGAGAAVVPEEKTTDADGRAEATLVLGTTIGRQTGQARVVQSGAAAIQASFSAVALPENANTMAAVAGQDQTGHVGQPLDDRLVVEVTDNFGNPVAGVLINWAAVGGGSVSAAEVATDEDGRSRVDRILGPAVGQQSTVASADGLAGSPVTFIHTALAGDASRLTIVTGNDQTGEAGETLPDELVVRLIDADGNGVPGTAVSWVVATGGGSANPETTTTDGDGRTSTRWTLGGTLGAQRLDAVVSGVGVASFRATGTAGAPASLFIRTQPSATARNGVPLNRQPVIQLRDSRGNDVSQSGVQITAAIGSGGGELGGDRQVATDGSGRATFTNLSISGAPGPRTLIFTATGYAQVTSSEIQLEAIGTTTTITDDTPDPSVSGTTFTVRFTVASSSGTPDGTVTVTVSGDGQPPSCSGTLNNGAGSCELTLNNAGNRTLTATYPGGNGFSRSSDTEAHTVIPVAPSNQPPTAEFATTCDELACRFEDQSSDPDGRIDDRQWNFGDGQTSDRQNPDHEFPSSGTYQVSLTVRDNGGATATVTHAVTVSQAAASTNTRFEVDDPDPTIPGQSFTVTLSVSSGRGTPEGTATVSDGVDGCTVPIAGGGGSCTLALSTVGDRTLTATFQGNASYATSSANESHRVNPPPPPPPAATTTTITGDGDDPSPFGQAITVTFTVTSSSGSPNGDVQVTSDGGGGSCSATVAQGSCSLTPGNGSTTITAVYQGSPSFAGSSDTEPHTMSPPPPATTTTSVLSNPDPSGAGAPITVSFTVTSTGPGTPTGVVRVRAPNGMQICEGNAPSGSCPNYTPGWVGSTETITATYEGNSSFQGSSGADQHTVNPPPPANTVTTVTTPSPSLEGETMTVTFTVTSTSGDPAGTVLVTDAIAGGCSGTVAQGSCQYPPPGTGERTITAAYQGNPSFLASSASVQHMVNAPPLPPPAEEDSHLRTQ